MLDQVVWYTLIMPKCTNISDLWITPKKVSMNIIMLTQWGGFYSNWKMNSSANLKIQLKSLTQRYPRVNVTQANWYHQYYSLIACWIGTSHYKWHLRGWQITLTRHVLDLQFYCRAGSSVKYLPNMVYMGLTTCKPVPEMMIPENIVQFH